MSTDLFHELSSLSAEGRTFVVATVVSTSGSTPQKPGSRMVVLEDGQLRGTVGGGAIEQQVVEAARALLASAETHRLIQTHLTHELGMCCGGSMQLFLEKHVPASRLWVFGAGHVAQELARLAGHVGFHVTVVDERPEWTSAERFPAATRVVRHPTTVAAELPGGPDCYFCVTTHDHPLDQAVVEALLPKQAAYVGVIGSRRKAERFRQRLRAADFTEAQVERLRSPMGIAIHALTPAEIAVSIVAELVATRRGKEAQR
ncbi:MAG: xanthine dehydrogenase accessory protein XdhC [Deltaproteobacteria bacterium]|nr:xanthine dehydrogenase accessory protein XdhC [Deltaproteobacteria bacterium]